MDRPAAGCVSAFFFFQAEDGIRYLVRSRGLGDVYKRQHQDVLALEHRQSWLESRIQPAGFSGDSVAQATGCLLYTSDAADERSRVDLGGRRIINKKTRRDIHGQPEADVRHYDLAARRQRCHRKIA